MVVGKKSRQNIEVTEHLEGSINGNVLDFNLWPLCINVHIINMLVMLLLAFTIKQLIF